MANRRMFARTITDSDAFTDMPLSTQALYFHLWINADDEGFVSGPKRVQRSIGATDGDLSLLMEKEFVRSCYDGCDPLNVGVVIR